MDVCEAAVGQFWAAAFGSKAAILCPMSVKFEGKSPYYSRRGGTRVPNKVKPDTSLCASRRIPANIGRVQRVFEVLALTLCLAVPLLAQDPSGSSASSTTRSD